jgi:hypothetical protein
MKMPSRRDVNKVLGRNVFGWNDKRKCGNRIKLIELLSSAEMQLLRTELPKMFPNFKFSVDVFHWYNFGYWRIGGMNVTTITYSAI